MQRSRVNFRLFLDSAFNPLKLIRGFFLCKRFIDRLVKLLKETYGHDNVAARADQISVRLDENNALINTNTKVMQNCLVCGVAASFVSFCSRSDRG